jgi:hydroxymethylbilane synthase
VPAVSQGAIGLEIADGRDDVLELLAPILCKTTTKACAAERFFMNRLQGGCSVSLGAYARQEEGQWLFDAWVSDPVGERFLRDSFAGDDPQQLAQEAVESFLSRGAADIMGRE